MALALSATLAFAGAVVLALALAATLSFSVVVGVVVTLATLSFTRVVVASLSFTGLKRVSAGSGFDKMKRRTLSSR